MPNPLSWANKTLQGFGANLYDATHGSPLNDIHKQVAGRKKQKGKPKAAAKPPITSASDPRAAARQLRPNSVGQTAGSKKAIIEGINKDSPY